MTGRLPRPQPLSSGRYPSHPPADTQVSHSANVTSCLPTAKGCEIVTSCGRTSSPSRPTSDLGEPMTNEPAGTTTISGQDGQSRNVSPAFGPTSASASSAVGTNPARPPASTRPAASCSAISSAGLTTSSTLPAVPWLARSEAATKATAERVRAMSFIDLPPSIGPLRMLVHSRLLGQAGWPAERSGAGRPAWHDDRLWCQRPVPDGTRRSPHSPDWVAVRPARPVPG